MAHIGESQLKTAAGVTYTYDGDGRRAAKVGTKLYWYGSGGEILSETDASGITRNDYIFFGGKRVAMVPATGSALFYAEDTLGTSRVIVQSTGTLCYDADFVPFGGEKTQLNTCPQNYKFEGKERDTETGNDDFGARYYSWRFGRWLSADWSSVPVPVPYANLTNPQTLNLYAMVADDPESFADLDGHDTCNGPNNSCEAKNTPPVAGNTNVLVTQSQKEAADAKQKAITAATLAQRKSWWQKALSYFYVKTGNGRGIGLNNVKVGTGKVDFIFRTNGKDVKQTTQGKMVTTVNSEVGVKVEFGPIKVGVERTNTQEEGQPAKTEWVPGFEWGKFEGSNAEVGAGAGGCLILCGQIEVGVQADKLLSDVRDAAAGALEPILTSGK